MLRASNSASTPLISGRTHTVSPRRRFAPMARKKGARSLATVIGPRGVNTVSFPGAARLVTPAMVPIHETTRMVIAQPRLVHTAAFSPPGTILGTRMQRNRTQVKAVAKWATPEYGPSRSVLNAARAPTRTAKTVNARTEALAARFRLATVRTTEMAATSIDKATGRKLPLDVNPSIPHHRQIRVITAAVASHRKGFRSRTSRRQKTQQSATYQRSHQADWASTVFPSATERPATQRYRCLQAAGGFSASGQRWLRFRREAGDALDRTAATAKSDATRNPPIDRVARPIQPGRNGDETASARRHARPISCLEQKARPAK